MSNRTFAALLAGFLMFIGGATILMMRQNNEIPLQQSDTAVSIGENAGIRSPLERWQVLEEYGARYNELLSQWEMNVSILLEAKEKDRIVAPVEGIIEGLEVYPQGGSRVIIKGEKMTVCVWPVTGVCVFQGSWIDEGEILGTATGNLYLWVQQEGVAINPEKLVESAA